jgi:hypothetical protein
MITRIAQRIIRFSDTILFTSKTSDKIWLLWLHNLAGIFTKLNKVNLSIQRKITKVFTVNDKIRTLKKIKLLTVCFSQYEILIIIVVLNLNSWFSGLHKFFWKHKGSADKTVWEPLIYNIRLHIFEAIINCVYRIFTIHIFGYLNKQKKKKSNFFVNINTIYYFHRCKIFYCTCYIVMTENVIM